jgi:hypothetical protein
MKVNRKQSLICAVGLALLVLPLTGAVSVNEPMTPGEINPTHSVEELAKLKQDPLSELRTVIFQAEVSPNEPGSGKTEGSYSIQPVWPFPLTKDWKLLTYNLPKGWFLFSNATISANWFAASYDRWTVPVGGGIGKVFNIGKQSFSLSAQVFDNVIGPQNEAETTAIVQFSLLFP